MERGICDATTRATGDERAGSVPLTARPDHRHETRIGEAGADDRLAFSGGEVRGGVHRQAGPAAVADAADGGAGDPQAQLRPFRRGSVRSLGGEPVLPILLRRGIFPTCIGIRSVIADALASADGRREASGASAGEPGGSDPDGRDEAVRSRPCCDRYHGAAEGGDVPDRRQTFEPGARAAGAAGDEARRQPAPILSPGRQAGADQAPALRPCPSVQARQSQLTQAQDLSWPRHPRHRASHCRLLREAFVRSLFLARRVLQQERHQRGRKVYSLHAPEVECIGKGKAHRPYEFGVKVSVATPVRHSAGGQFVTHVAALPGNPYDGHTLATVIPQMQALIGNVLDRCITDAGYRGHNAPPDYKFKVYTSGQKRRLTPQIKREFKRRAAIGPVIGHLKEHHRMGRNQLAHASGDAINAVLAAAGYNFRRLLAWLRFLLLKILVALALHAQLKLA